MSEVFFIAGYVASIFFLPWWMALFFGVVLLAYYKKYFFVLAGGLMLDALYGAPFATLSGFSYLYTALLLILIGMDMAFRSQLLD